MRCRIACSTPYRNVVCLGHIVDEDGLKMSKSKGNVVDPWDVFARHGADALRWYFFAAGQPWSSRRTGPTFDEGIREMARQTLLTLWNVFSFFATYADLNGWSPPASGGPPEPTHVLDRWILGVLDDTTGAMTGALDGFDALTATGRLTSFVNDLSNWYVRRSRPRFWSSDDVDAHATLHHCLVTASTLLAPFCPFLADELYTALTGRESVHLADWPASRPAEADRELADAMAAGRRLVALGRAARTDAKVKVRQPLRRALLLHPGRTLDEEVRAQIAGELNVKELTDVDTLSDLISWTVSPNFRRLGPRLGPRLPAVKAALAGADGSALKRALDADGSVEVAGERLEPDDVEVRASRHEAFALAEDQGWAVALDLELDDDLRAEGTARELVRVLNDLRKERGFAIADRIEVQLSGGPNLHAALHAHRDWIAGEVLAERLEVGDPPAELPHRFGLDGEAASAALVAVPRGDAPTGGS